ncbi:MAG: proton-conducting transporter membrane subunit, partial [Alistipes onderdonkii]
YARGYLAGYLDRKQPVQISLHYFALAIMFFSMLLVVLFRDGFGFLFSWESMTIASFVLILFDAERKEVRRAALNYLVLMHVGFVFLLVGFVSRAARV